MPNREYAPGIPIEKDVKPIPRVSKPKVWDFVIQEHDANKAGKHFDLRLGDPQTGAGHSWALRRLPKPGEKVLANQQPTHTLPYFDFKGKIEAGYGAGDVKQHTRSRAEIHRSTENKIVFSLYNGKQADEYALVRVDGRDWLLVNRTPTDKSWKIPSAKPKYKEKKISEVDPADKSEVMAAKIDGAHVTLHLKPGKEPRIFSHRPTERATGVIEHTRRVPVLSEQESPRELGSMVLRGELYARGKDGKALRPEQVGALLNSNVWKSREKQKSMGNLRLALFDVVSKGTKNLEGEEYDRKLSILRAVKKAMKGIEIPRMAVTEEAKERLLSDIKGGREPSTREGVVLWGRDGSRPVKAKIKQDYDVYVRKVLKGKKPGHAGAYAYSLTPRSEILGNVGTGMSHLLRKEMFSDPDKFIGMIAKVTAQNQFPSGALRAPAHQGFHLDKNVGSRLMELESQK